MFQLESMINAYYLILKPWHHHTHIHTHTAAISTVCTNTSPPSSSSIVLCCRQYVGEARNSGDSITNYDQFRCYEAKVERLKPEVVSWVRLPATASFFTFLYFCPITSKLIYFQREAKMLWVYMTKLFRNQTFAHVWGSGSEANSCCDDREE